MLLYFYTLTFVASLSPTYGPAADTTRRALLGYPTLQSDLDELSSYTERYVYTYTGLTAKELTYAGYFYPLVTKTISSKPFKNFKYTFKSKITLVPELNYSLLGQGATIGLFIVKDF